MNVRRVVTGHDASGKSVFVSDEAVASPPHTGLHRLWGGDTTARLAVLMCGAANAGVPAS